MRRITTIEYKPNQGAQGEQGPPGTGATFPIDSSNILYAPTGQTVEQVLDGLLFVNIDILSFTTPQIVFEIGQVLTALVFSWALNKNPVGQTISGTSVTPPTLVPSDRSKSVSFASLSSNGSVTLTTTDEEGSDSATIGLSFYHGVFYGSAPIPGAVNSAFVNGLTKSLQAARQKDVTLNLTAGVYGWVFVPVAYGIPSFKVNGFPGGMIPITVVSVTNGYGYTENYYASRTEFANLGLTEIEIL